ncbi:hypothetical protein M3Y98_00221400 [Aphelenchoides besseyi]|nr:hypothetical protein M3Y98_00221400 [Aphelenchoides besseyi]
MPPTTEAVQQTAKVQVSTEVNSPLTNKTARFHASRQLMPPTTEAVQQTAKVQVSTEVNSPLTNKTARFHGRHTIWRHFLTLCNN